jgi:hypothetical protein
VFGLSPKFSTPVEKTVEIRSDLLRGGPKRADGGDFDGAKN